MDKSKWKILYWIGCRFIKKKERVYYKSFYCTKGGDGTKGIKWGTDKQKEALANRRSYKGENNPNFGHHLSEESKEKIRLTRLGSKQNIETIKKKSKPILQYTLDDVFIKEWIGAALVMHELGIDKSSIGRVCLGKKKSAGGFKWKYKTDSSNETIK